MKARRLDTTFPASLKYHCQVRNRIYANSIVSLSSSLLIFCLSCGHRDHPTITFISQTTAVGLWEPARTGSLNAVSGTPYSIRWVGPVSVDDIQDQINLLDEAVKRHSAGIILAPNHPLALITAVQQAISAGIPTVVISSPLQLSASPLLFCVLNDENEEGRIAARRIGTKLKGHGTVAILGLNSNNGGLDDRMRSFENTLKTEFPEIRILSRHLDSSSEAQAEQIARGLLTGHSEPDAVLALTSTASSGMVRAIEDSPSHRHIVLVSCDQTYVSLYPLSQGEIDSVVAENTFTMGSLAAQLIMSARSGRSLANKIYVQPTLVTRENMFSPDLLKILTYDTRALY